MTGGKDQQRFSSQSMNNFVPDFLTFSEENKSQENSRPLEHRWETSLLFLLQTIWTHF
jgi:hypothetical protein